MTGFRYLLLIACGLGTVAERATADDSPAAPPAQQAADKASLAPLQSYVGSWRGMGQVQRGSTQGAWIEQADWVWKFADGRAELTFAAPKGKHYIAGRVVPLKEQGKFQLTATRPDGKTTDRFTGQSKEGQWVFVADQPSADFPARITLKQVAEGKRLVVLLERRAAGGQQYTQLAEIGYTRQGSDFGKGTIQRECVVTGGLGTIAVQYEGKTYYVCCSGCRELFDENPAAVLAEYRKRKAEEK
jgi:hypothetical protein